MQTDSGLSSRTARCKGVNPSSAETDDEPQMFETSDSDNVTRVGVVDLLPAEFGWTALGEQEIDSSEAGALSCIARNLHFTACKETRTRRTGGDQHMHVDTGRIKSQRQSPLKVFH